MFNERVNKRTIMITSVAIAVMLVSTTVMSMSTTADNAFAYSSNQAKSDVNSCGNGVEPTNVGCQNIDSQIQGDRNSVAMTNEQSFPEAEEGPTSCNGCFSEPLSETQANALAEILTDQFGITFPTNPTKEQIIDTICNALESGDLTVQNVDDAMALVAGLPEPNRQAITNCLEQIFNV